MLISVIVLRFLVYPVGGENPMFSVPQTTAVHWFLMSNCDTGVTIFRIKIAHGYARATRTPQLGELSINSLSGVTHTGKNVTHALT